jgi:hypothetical protein
MLEHGTRHIRELTGSACERILRNGRNSRALSRSQIRSSTNASETILVYRGVLSTQYVCDIGNARKNKILSMWRESERGLDNTISKMVHILRLKLSGVLMLGQNNRGYANFHGRLTPQFPQKTRFGEYVLLVVPTG